MTPREIGALVKPVITDDGDTMLTISKRDLAAWASAEFNRGVGLGSGVIMLIILLSLLALLIRYH